MQNNSKPPPQTQPSTLDIVLKNGQMNLATAIGRLEQAVTKAYGNINSSINSKQGEFNQALLKTLDQSISKSSNKMDQFYTSSFAKIYALNSAIMEQSLQRSGMVAAQKDLEGYRNLDKVFDNQQRAFGDMNVSLKQIIEKIAPMTSEQKMFQTANVAQANNADYMDVSMFEQFTSLHDVSRPEAHRAFADIQKNLFNVRNTENFDKDPFVEALTKNSPELLKKLKGTSDRTEFIMLLIENITKAFENNNQDVLKKLPEYIKKPGIMATFTDGYNIHLPNELENKYPEILNNTVYERARQNAQKQRDIHDKIEEKGYHNRNVGVANDSYVVDLFSRLHYYSVYLDQKNNEHTNQYRTDIDGAVRDNVKDSISGEYDQQYKDDLAFVVIKGLLPGLGESVVEGVKRTDKSALGIKYTFGPNAPENVNKPVYKGIRNKNKRPNDTEKELAYLAKKKAEIQLKLKEWPVGIEADRNYKIIAEIDKRIHMIQKISSGNYGHVNVPRNLIPPSLVKQPSSLYTPMIKQVKDFMNISLNPLQHVQRNRDFANMQIGLKPQSKQGNTVTVHNHNKFTMTFNKGDYDPNHFMSSVNRQISNFTAEAIARYKGVDN